MENRVKKAFLTLSSVPEECATDYWFENNFLLSKEEVDRNELLSDLEIFFSDTDKYYNHIDREFSKSTRFRNRPYDPNYFYIRDIPSYNPNRRFANVIIEKIIDAYVNRGKVCHANKFVFELCSHDRPVNTEHFNRKVSLQDMGFDIVEILLFVAYAFYDKKYIESIGGYERHNKSAIEASPDFPVGGNIDSDLHDQSNSNKSFYSNFLNFITGEKEGVTEEGSHQVEEDKLESGKLPTIFDGTLDRDAMARALDAVMEQKGLSVRKAADQAGTSAGIISSVRDQRASLDKAVEVLDKLGFVAEISVRPKDPS